MNLQTCKQKLTEKTDHEQRKIDLRDALIVAFDRTRSEPLCDFIN
jgi:hypothetical protein